MTTIKDIAECAGVSTATVSNVIHGNTKKVSPATIELTDREPDQGNGICPENGTECPE